MPASLNIEKTYDFSIQQCQLYLQIFHEIDDSISLAPGTNRTIEEAFVIGLGKLRENLREAIPNFYHPDLKGDYQHFTKLINNADQIFDFHPAELLALNAELDKLNIEIIEAAIQKSKTKDQSYLNIKCISRFPKAIIDDPKHQSYWLNLKKLDLSYNRLRNLPNNITKLQSLESLDISNNYLLLKLPNAIGDLKQLRSLLAMSNSLSTLPDSIENLSQLEYLDISDNEFTKLPNCLNLRQNLLTWSFQTNTPPQKEEQNHSPSKRLKI